MMQRVLLVLLYFCSFFVFSGDTVLKLYRPFGEVTEQSIPVVKKQLVGHCDSQSQLILREDAWRCQVEGNTFDPCFVKPAGKKMEALCPQSPWVGDSIAILVPVPLINDQHISLDMSQAYPWAIELVNGEHCEAIASTERFDSMNIRYRCGNQHVLVGPLQRCKSVWSMLEKSSTGVAAVDFKKVWF
jgi:hypothetical protein